MDLIFGQFVAGLSYGSTLFLLSAGLTLIFGVTRVVNFAHGSLYMIGAYVASTATAAFKFQFRSPFYFILRFCTELDTNSSYYEPRKYPAKLQ